MGHACEWETSMMLHLAPGLVGDLSQVEAVSPRMPFEPASQGWITKDRSTAGHIGDPRQATAAKGEALFRVVLPGRRHLSRAGDPMGWPFLGWMKWTGAKQLRLEPGASGHRSRTWAICVLMLLATMLNYMDRLALSQQATEISRELGLTNKDYADIEQGFGIAFAIGGIVTGLAADRISPRWLYPGRASLLVARRLCDRLGHNLSRAARLQSAARFLRGRPVAVRSGHSPAPALTP